MQLAAGTGISAKTDIFSQEPIKPVEGTNNNAFGQDAFLKLLVSQLRYQDPSEPVDNEQFLGQMAQFTSVEQITKLNKTMEKLAGSSVKTDAVALLGSEVELKPSGQLLQEGDIPTTVTGIVKQVRFEGEAAKIQVNGLEYSMEDIIKVRVPNTK